VHTHPLLPPPQLCVNLKPSPCVHASWMASANKGECIRTLCRFRPLNAREKALQGGTDTEATHAMTLGEDGRSVWLGADKSGGQFTLDAMLGSNATQQDAYDQISGIVDSVLQGYNGTLLAYGQVCPESPR
jgi:hypothetical protein